MDRSRRWRAVRELLCSFYAEVLPLEVFVRHLQMRTLAKDQPQPLVQDGDPGSYCTLVAQCLVGRLAACKALPAYFGVQQVSCQDDVLTRIIQRICQKKKKNVLTFGYTLLNENNYQLPCMPNIGSYMPNHSTETIRQNVLWEIILNRVGDDIMMYILEHCALFLLVPPNCCYQICGEPIYELASRNVTRPPKFIRQRIHGPSPCILTTYLRKRFQSCRWYPRKTKWKKWNSERQKWNEPQQHNSQRSSVAQNASGQTPTKKKQFMRTGEHIEKQQKPSLNPSLRTQCLKRKWTGQCDINAKKIKIMIKEDNIENNSRNPDSRKKQNQLILDSDKPETSRICIQSCSKGLTLMNSVPQNGGVQISEVTSAANDNQGALVCEKQDSISKTFCESNLQPTCNAKLPKLVTRTSDISSVRLGLAKTVLPEKDLGICSSKSVGKSYNSISVVHIERHSLLYSYQRLKECLPKSFVLNHLKGHPAGGQRLVEQVFFSSKILKQPGSSSVQSGPKKKKRLPKRYWQMRSVFQELLRNHAKCPYQTILKKNCPISVSEPDTISLGEQSCKQTGHQAEEISSKRQQDNPVEGCIASRSGALNPFSEMGASSRRSERTELSRKKDKEQVFQDSSSSDFIALLKQYSSHWQVYTFVRGCLERVVPPALWGSNHNKCRFYRNVKKFISLGKFAMFSLEELTWKMRVSDCAWLRLSKESGHSVPASEHRFREELMSKFLYWLMGCYVSELLRSFFYITETAFQKNLLFYFRKTVWSKLQSIGIRSHLAKVQLHPLLKEDIEHLQHRNCVPLASKLRFIPKPNGLRPVVKLHDVVGAETFCRNSRDKQAQHFNMRLKNVFSVLNYERLKNPILLGSTVFGKDDIYITWKKFISKVLESYAEMPKFYFVKADVTGAYDTLPHDKLVEVILQALAPERNTTYSIRRYAAIMRTGNGCIKKYYRRHVSTYNEFIDGMKQFVSHLQQNTSLRNAIIVEQSVFLKESSSSLREFFLQLIHNNILKIKDRYYVQRCGIPQGSILSTLLCNLCYGDMENKLLRNVQKDGVLMRLTDDFLLVTPHLEQAKTFLRTLAKGIPEYGFVINPSKTVVNFPVDENVPGCLEFKQLPAHCVIPWCGLLINTQTLEIYCDYSSYAYTTIRSSLTFNSTRKAGVNMRNKLLAVLQLKCHPLFIDLQINSLRTVCINIYKILLLQAYRFHACILQLPFHHHIKNNPRFFLTIISDSASCSFSVLKAKNAGSSVPLSYKAVQWLSYHAFSTKLANHKVIYKCLLGPLRQCSYGEKIFTASDFPFTTRCIHS
ncbi:telomerase reverse transcriptase isoform X2 [Ahaetulla prasina]|uniref:telomerase reverse transcriptase isoform X2 n=1 Tax=Ahaetulla prasina TaxID=499056 RepID=UPI00264A24B3|nr:telomerase reverse transcriptase isoform X2 [Ahaetulla prasina]